MRLSFHSRPTGGPTGGRFARRRRWGPWVNELRATPAFAKVLVGAGLWLIWGAPTGFGAVSPSTGELQSAPAPVQAPPGVEEQRWNWHVQNTDIVQGDPSFPARYSGPKSLHSGGEVRETVSLDLLAGVRLWPGAEAHVDGLMWQGFGLSQTLGVEGFPNGEAFRVGTKVPNVVFARLFLRQTFRLGEEEESVRDDQLHLAGSRPVNRLTLTLGKVSAKDLFDNNSYANDPRTQFLNWGLMANEAWDYPADSLGYITGFAAEVSHRPWAWRYAFFQVPRTANGLALDPAFLRAWGMVTELERAYAIQSHPGVLRLLAFLNRANMGTYRAALAEQERPADIQPTREYQLKYGFGLNWEQELTEHLGVFSRLGWGEGRREAWMFADVDYTLSTGLSLKGRSWGRPDDTVGAAAVFNGISRVHQDYFAAGGTGILAGDGRLRYGWERIFETYYDFAIWRTIHGALDYQFVSNPAFNRGRGPVSIISARLHWEF